jgi:hypothetical protein
VTFRLRTTAGTVLESGPAVEEHGIRTYHTTANVPAGTDVQIEITAAIMPQPKGRRSCRAGSSIVTTKVVALAPLGEGVSPSIATPTPAWRLALLPTDEDHCEREHRREHDELGGARFSAQENESDREQAKVRGEHQPTLPTPGKAPTPTESFRGEPILLGRNAHGWTFCEQQD